MMKAIDLKESNELLKEVMFDNGFTQEQYHTIGLAFAKLGLLVVDASEYLESLNPPHFALVEVTPVETVEAA